METETTTTIEKSDCLGRHAGRMFFSLDVSSSSYHPQYCHYLPLNEWLIHLSQVGRHMEHRHYTRQEGEGACYIDNGQILLFLHLLRNLDIRRFDLSKKKNACVNLMSQKERLTMVNKHVHNSLPELVYLTLFRCHAY